MKKLFSKIMNNGKQETGMTRAFIIPNLPENNKKTNY